MHEQSCCLAFNLVNLILFSCVCVFFFFVCCVYVVVVPRRRNIRSLLATFPLLTPDFGFWEEIGHFTFMDGSEADGDLVLVQTFLLYYVNQVILMLTSIFQGQFP